MNANASPNTLDSQPLAPSWVGAKLLNLLVSPSVVFDEVVGSSSKWANWLVPTALVCLSNLIFLDAMSAPGLALEELVKGGKLTEQTAVVLTAHWQIISRAAICLCSFLGVLWSGFVIWFIGRVFLKSRFGFGKALEVAGLSATILVLGTVTTGLLVLAVGDGFARPALSLLALKMEPASHVRAVLEVLNVFHLWATALLAIGVSKLSNVTVRESAFWVFGYWVLVRVALVLLA